MADERPYYTLVAQYDIGYWGKKFGDFDRDTVEVEAKKFNGKSVIHRSDSVDDFGSLNAKIADLNRGDFGVVLC